MLESLDYVIHHRVFLTGLSICVLIALTVIVLSGIRMIETVTSRVLLDKSRTSIIQSAAGVMRHTYLNACSCSYLEKGTNLKAWFKSSTEIQCPHCGKMVTDRFNEGLFKAWNRENPINQRVKYKLDSMSFVDQLKFMWNSVFTDDSSKATTRHLFVRRDEDGMIRYCRVFHVPGFEDALKYTKNNLSAIAI